MGVHDYYILFVASVNRRWKKPVTGDLRCNDAPVMSFAMIMDEADAIKGGGKCVTHVGSIALTLFHKNFQI